MAPEDRRETADLELVAANAPEFEFFQAVRLLRRLWLARAQAEGTAPPGDWPEPIRFRSNVSYAFMASDVQKAHVPANGDPPVVTVNFLGIATPASHGSLPTCYTQFLLEEARGDDQHAANHAPREFFDLFNDRLTALFFRTIVKNNLPIQYELGRDGVVTRMLFGVFGLGVGGLADRLGIDARALVFYASLLLRRPTTTACLEHVLSKYFGIRFEIDSFVPMDSPLDSDNRWQLGDHSGLGTTIVVGDRASMRQGKFRLRTEPLHWRQFEGLLPGRTPAQHPPMLRELMTLVRQAVGGEFEWDLQLVLAERAVPRRMLLNAAQPMRARLGLSSWLGKRFGGGDAHDTIVQASLLEGNSS